MTTPHLKKSIGRSSLRLALLLIPLVFACFALSPMAQAVIPAPDGGYPGGNTAEGDNAFSAFLQPRRIQHSDWLAFALFATPPAAATRRWRGRARSQHLGTTTRPLALERFFNTTGGNTAVGAAALLQQYDRLRQHGRRLAGALNEQERHGNSAVGALALQNNTMGSLNTAVGAGALTSNTDATQTRRLALQRSV